MSNTQNFTSLVSLLRAHRAALSDDIQVCLKPNSVHFFGQSTLDAAHKYGIDLALMFTLPQKQVKRATQFLNACNTGLLSGFDKTHARLLLSMRAAGDYDLNTDALHVLAAGLRAHDKGANTRGISVATINTQSQSKGSAMGTVTSKTSNSTGRNGFMNSAGMTWGDSTTNHTISLNNAHPAVKRFFQIVDTSTKGQLEAVGK